MITEPFAEPLLYDSTYGTTLITGRDGIILPKKINEICISIHLLCLLLLQHATNRAFYLSIDPFAWVFTLCTHLHEIGSTPSGLGTSSHD
jgi:hypothetical protein